MNATGRGDFDRMVKISSVPSDEPVFLIRAQDAVSADAVRAWATLAAEAGAPMAVIEQALQQADRMAAWPVKKIADDKHLADHERKQLAWQLMRRLWDGGRGPAAIHEAGALFSALLKALVRKAEGANPR